MITVKHTILHFKSQQKDGYERDTFKIRNEEI